MILLWLMYNIEEIDNTPIARQVYITSPKDVTITHGLILNSTRVTANAIPTTNRTPQGLTYGGSPQAVNTQTNYGPVVHLYSLCNQAQRITKILLLVFCHANADGQAFATPDTTNGLIDATQFLNTLGPTVFRSCGL
jgi:hypothetical protein